MGNSFLTLIDWYSICYYAFLTVFLLNFDIFLNTSSILKPLVLVISDLLSRLLLSIIHYQLFRCVF
nr:hypothetical protein A5482_14245 [Cyanobacterium sp. IPPAS B-1200]